MAEPTQRSACESLSAKELSEAERRAYVLALVTLANVDSEASPEELAFIQHICAQLGCRLGSRDLVSLDLAAIAASITRPIHRKALFEDLLQMARRDRKWHGGELRVLKFLGDQWGLEPPTLADVVWEQLVGTDAAGVRQLSKETSQAVAQRPEVAQAVSRGFRWLWAAATVVLFLVACMGASVLAGVLDSELLAGVARLEPLAVLLFLAAGCLTGLVVGAASPGRTVLEPAVGAALPLLAVFAFVALFVLPEQDGEGSAALAGSFFAAIVFAFVATMGGAWLGERLTGGRSGDAEKSRAA